MYIFDLDGTLYRGAEPIPGAVATVAALRDRGALIRYVTNNSGQTLPAFLKKLRNMGFAADEHELMSSGLGTLRYLREEQLRRVFVVGEPGLVSTLRAGGVEVINADADDRPHEGETDWAEGLLPSYPADAVVAGVCREALSYRLLSGAMQHLRAGARFIATNPDPSFPMEGGRFTPGAGTMVAALQTCGGVAPFVVGKPSPYLISILLAEAGMEASDAVVVGDRLDTDIEAGKLAGTHVHLVLTGVETVAPPHLSHSADVSGLLALA